MSNATPSDADDPVEQAGRLIRAAARDHPHVRAVLMDATAAPEANVLTAVTLYDPDRAEQIDQLNLSRGQGRAAERWAKRHLAAD